MIQQVVTGMYLKISLSDSLSLYVARFPTWFFFAKAPGKRLIAAFVFAMGLSTILAVTWPLGDGASTIDARMAAVVWVYCLVWFLVQDAAKVAIIRLMERSNQFDMGHTTSHKRVCECTLPYASRKLFGIPTSNIVSFEAFVRMRHDPPTG
ncbi:unnamed protein product [Ectocarpus sp. CCAP 1310/34]|nr:unnamed protein product [Ectocarpus sp. CCAP 1310/34]